MVVVIHPHLIVVVVIVIIIIIVIIIVVNPGLHFVDLVLVGSFPPDKSSRPPRPTVGSRLVAACSREMLHTMHC